MESVIGKIVHVAGYGFGNNYFFTHSKGCNANNVCMRRDKSIIREEGRYGTEQARCSGSHCLTEVNRRRAEIIKSNLRKK